MACSVEGCDKPINKNDVCLRHKLLSVHVGTVPGGAKDERTRISLGRERERGLHRYRELKQAGEQPSGTTLEAQRKDSYKKHLWEKRAKDIEDNNPPEVVKKVKRSLINKE